MPAITCQVPISRQLLVSPVYWLFRCRGNRCRFEVPATSSSTYSASKIDKWLKAGVMEDGNVSYPDSGSPQGGVVSPLISNVFLHYVLDLWFEQEVKPRLAGDAFLVRYADDLVIGFRNHRDAERVMEVIPKRLGKYGLTVHPTKTKLISFRPPSSRTKDDHDRPGTFDLLGFTHYWGVSLKGY